MPLPWFERLSGLSKLSLFAFVLLLVAVFATVSFSLNQQQITSRAWLTSQSAQAKCDESGEAIISVTFTNTETDSALGMNVAAKDVQTGLSVNLASVSAQQTQTAEIQTHVKQLSDSSVIFFLSWINNDSGTDQRGASYKGITCEQMPTPTLTSTPSPKPTATPTATPTDKPTPTVAALNTYFVFDVFFHGIGLAGDSANPSASGNLNPVHKQKTIVVDVYDNQNKLVLSKSGEVEFASSSGSFLGRMDMGNAFTDGAYAIKIKSAMYLRKSLSGIITVREGRDNNLPEVVLVTGDINNDNVINILDYNLLMGCYSDLYPATRCDSGTLADLTDDGAVNQFDYNLFLRELTYSVGK